MSPGQVFVQVAASLPVWREKPSTQHGIMRVVQSLNKLCGHGGDMQRTEGAVVGQAMDHARTQGG